MVECNYTGTVDISCGIFSNVILFSPSLVLRDTVIQIQKHQFDIAFCIRWPENMQFKRCIIDRYMIKL